MITVVIIGIGNIGTHIYNALKKKEAVQIVQLYNRSKKALVPFASEVTTTTNLASLKNVDIYIIASSDNSIATISSKIPHKNKLVVHTSGSISITELTAKNRRGSFYPLQTFSKNAIVDFKNIPICIEAENEKDLLLLHQLAEKLSDVVYEISSEQRKSLHLAAVFVNNFTNHLYHIGEEICAENNVPFNILSPLISETVQKLNTLSPYNAQTGPAKRNDTGTIQRHLKELKNKNHKEIYTALSKSITSSYGKKL